MMSPSRTPNHSTSERGKPSFDVLLDFWNEKCTSNGNDQELQQIRTVASAHSSEKPLLHLGEDCVIRETHVDMEKPGENAGQVYDRLVNVHEDNCQPKSRGSPVQVWFAISLPVLILMVVVLFGIPYSSTHDIYQSDDVSVEGLKLRPPPKSGDMEQEFVFLKMQISEHLRYFNDGPDISKIGLHSTYPTPLHHNAPSVFVKYIDWHATQMKCLRSPDCYREHKDKIKITLWKCPSDSPLLCAGTGDRMRGIITSLALSMMTNRVFLLEWPDNPYPFLHAVSPAALDWRLPEHIRNDTLRWGIARDKKYPMMEWLQCPESYVCSHRKFERSVKEFSTIVPRVMDLEEDHTFVYLRRIGNYIIHSVATYSFNLYRRPEWSTRFSDDAFRGPTTSVLAMNRYLLRALFRPSPFIESILNSFIFPEAIHQGYVAIHARTGEDVGEADRVRFKKLHDTRHSTVAKNFLRCAKQTGLKAHQFVYFASDSIGLKSEFNKLAGRSGINVMMSRLPAIHVAHDSEAIEEISNVDDLLANTNWLSFINVFVEFFAVSNGTSIISNRSEFSRLAHVLSNAEQLKTMNPSSSQDQCSL